MHCTGQGKASPAARAPRRPPRGRMDAEAGPGGRRGDGRERRQLRGLRCERGALTRADGSARWAQAGSVVQAAVYGPRSPLAGAGNSLEAEVEVVWRPLHGAPGPRERRYESVVRQSLRGVVLVGLHPRTAVLVVLQEIHDDGSLLACALNAASAALLDAGVPLAGVLASCSCAVVAPEEREGEPGLLLDPDRAEEVAVEGGMTLAFKFSSAEDEAAGPPADRPGVLTSETFGAVGLEQFQAGVVLARSGCRQIERFLRLSLEQQYCPR